MDRRNFLKSGTTFAGWLTASRMLKSAPGPIGNQSGSVTAPPSGSRTAGKLVDFSSAVVVAPPGLSKREHKAVRVLIEEVQKRTEVRWPEANAWPRSSAATIVVGSPSAIKGLKAEIPKDLPNREPRVLAEGYTLRGWRSDGGPAVAVVGSDERGVLFGVGSLLRALRMSKGSVMLAENLNLSSSPKYRLRGHQLGYRPKTNSYDGWDVPMWDQYIRDLVVFGTNAIELIPPRSDDQADSPNFPLPQKPMMVEMSRIADDYGLDVWIWYPAMDKDYSDPATVNRALAEWGEIFQVLPRIDAVLVPGGDPGHTRPRYMMALLEKQTANLHDYHPKAQMWMSPQSFDESWLNEFYEIIDREPRWLSGVAYGPQMRIGVDLLRKKIPERYPIRLYPDITHSLGCEYPVPDWDTAYALTEGREIINPRPEGYANILRRDLPYTVGFLAYSEGCNDDANKFLWSSLAWNPEAKVIDVLREYSRYFLGEDYSDNFAQGLLSLERNWQGLLLTNEGVDTTLLQFQAMEDAATPHDLLKWRFQQGLYRAYYDAYVRQRLLYETSLENLTLSKLEEFRRLGTMVTYAPDSGDEQSGLLNGLSPADQLLEAKGILDRTLSRPIAQDLRTRILELGEALYQSIRMQLAVERYKGEAVSRGANLDTLDAPVTNVPWLKSRISEISMLTSLKDQLQGIKEILNRTNPGPGGFYDDLGDLTRQPHLVRGPGSTKDPEFRASSLVGFGYPDRWGGRAPIAWKRWAESLYDAPLEMRYTGLDRQATYKVRVVYSGSTHGIKIKLVCDGNREIHPFMEKPWPPKPLEFDIPPEATSTGELNLAWSCPLGRGHNGTGCQVSEVWLFKA